MADAPLPLDRIEELGATRFGRVVARVVLVYADGRRVSCDLPDPTRAADTDDGSDLTPTQQRVMRVVKDSPTPLTRKAVAKSLGQSKATGRVGNAIRELLDDGRLFESGGVVTDDMSKFDDGE